MAPPKGFPKPRGSGKPKGYKAPHTRERLLAREAGRIVIQQAMARMTAAQIAAACGLYHLMLRNDDGTWRKAPETMSADEVARVLNGDPNLYWLSLKDPSTSAFNVLAAYAWDKPQEPPQALDVTLRGSVELIERLQRARKRVQEP